MYAIRSYYEKNKQPSSITFKAVPNGHEFTSLLLAVLNMDGIGKNLPDELLKDRIAQLNSPVEVKSYISLTCTNCPEVVQALNIMAMLNPNISVITSYSIHYTKLYDHPEFLRFHLFENLPRKSQLFLLHKGVTDFHVLCLEKGKCHPTTDHENIHFRKEILDDIDLSRDLGTAEDRNNFV